jgi:hypothetical protein
LLPACLPPLTQPRACQHYIMSEMSASRYLVAARAAGDLVQRQLDITDFVEDGVTRFKITYDTTQRNSARGRGFRFITILREGANWETEYGAADDTRPGWWALQDGVKKFFLSERVINFDMVINKREHGLCPLVDGAAGASGHSKTRRRDDFARILATPDRSITVS